MKTFADYILEKQNFIFGGKAGLTGKEYGKAKTFEELEKGDNVYYYDINDFNIKSISSYVYTFDNLNITNTDYDLLRCIWENGKGYNINILKSNIDKEYFVDFWEYKIRNRKHVRSYVYSTYEMTEEGVRDIANEAWKIKTKK